MRLILHIFLFLIAYLLLLPSTILNFCIVALNGGASGYFRDSAVRLDRYGCGEFRTLWNTLLIKKGGVRFRADGNTISAYLGANQIKGTLSFFGQLIAWLLDRVDKGHCVRAYDMRVSEIIIYI